MERAETNRSTRELCFDFVLHSLQILVEKPVTQLGNYNILRSTREISGDAEEVYRDLLIGDLQGYPIRGRARWEKRLSREEVIAVIQGICNEERIPFVRKLLDKKNRSNPAEDNSVILKEWKKLGGIYRGGRTCSAERWLRHR